MMEDAQLLREYAAGSEAAFRELVDRYVNLVYSAAIRHLENTPLAEDVVQAVFTALAQKALTLPRDVILGGWLYRHTCFLASHALRAERRRQARERQAVEMNLPGDRTEPAWEQLVPLLDEAMQRLGAGDRDALVLRYFEKRDLRAVGSALGVTEEAARKRVTRALDKLRSFLAHRGVTLSAATLATLLAGNAVIAAPAGLAASVGAGALSAAAASTSHTLTLLKLVTMTKLKIGIIGAVVVAAVVTPLAIRHQSATQLSAADATLREQAAERNRLQAENDRLSGQARQAGAATGQAADLQRLRSEAGALRRQTNDLAAARNENRRLQAAVDRPDTEPTEAQQQEIDARMSLGKSCIMAFAMYARSNQGRFPASFDDVADRLPQNAGTQSKPPEEQFQIVYEGTFTELSKLPNAQETIVMRQKEPSRYGNRWAKVYGYGDGHFEMHSQADKDFSAWEKQRLAASTK